MKAKKTSKMLTVMLLMITLLVAVPIHAEYLFIKNNSFEMFVLQDGGWTTFGDGLIYDVNNDIDYGWNVPYELYVGTFNPNTSQFPLGVPDGVNVAYSSGPTISQTLSDVLTANTHYSLMVDIGNVLYTDYGGYNIGLYAGGSLIASDNNTIPVADGTFATAVVQYTALPGNPLLGQLLEIRLNTAGLGPDTDFDNVRLSATVVPEPVSSTLFIVGGATLGFRRFRKTKWL